MITPKRTTHLVRRSPFPLMATHASTLYNFVLLILLTGWLPHATAQTSASDAAISKSNKPASSVGSGTVGAVKTGAGSGKGGSGKNPGSGQPDSGRSRAPGSGKSGNGSRKDDNKGGSQASKDRQAVGKGLRDLPDAGGLPPETQGDIAAYVQEIAAPAGPSSFVQWAGDCARSLRSQKPCWFQNQHNMGGVLGPLMAVPLCMLPDDPYAIMEDCVKSSRKFGEYAGNLNAGRMENKPLSAGVLSFERRHNQQLEQLTSLLDACTNNNTELTDCLGQQQIAAQLKTIRSYNLSSCTKLAALPPNGGATLPADYCIPTDTQQAAGNR